MINVLFVCLGNICRSPMAEAVFKDIVNRKGLTHKISIDSSGTAGYHIGEPPDPRTMSVLKDNDIEFIHTGQQFKSSDFDSHQYIITMDKSNLSDVLSMGGEHNRNVFLLRHFDPMETDGEVPDPYYGGERGFQEVFEMVKRSCTNLLDYIIKENQLV